MSTVRIIGLIVTSCLLAACPGPGGNADPDANPDDDSALPGGGLTISIRSSVDVPQDDGNVRIESLRLQAMSIRAIGDATTGNDELTTKADYELRWDDGHAPTPFTFAMAPTGRYSQIEIRAAAGPSRSKSLVIKGSVRVDGDSEDFEIDLETGVVTASIEISETLAPGGTTSIELEADLPSLVDSIDWEAVPTNGSDVHVIDDSRPEMAGIRTRLAQMFNDTHGD